MERQETLVIDTSVLVKWFLNEEDSEKARSIRSKLINEEVSLIAPEFLFIETLNALRYNYVKEKDILTANKILFKLNLDIKKLDKNVMDETIQNAIKYDITIYDALYVALAQIHKTKLITADKKLMKIPDVVGLEDLEFSHTFS